MKSLPIFLISLFFLFSISTAEEKNEKIETPFLNWIINTMEAAAQTVSNTQAKNAKSKDAHCLACGFQMVGGRYVGLCPKCGSDRWYRTTLTPNAKLNHGGEK